MKTTMKIQIKHRHTGAVLHEGDYVSMMDAVAGAIKSRANLSRANLSGSDLSRSNIDLKALQVQLIIARTRILPEGDLVGWKKLQGGLIAKLLIPAKAKRSHAFGRKCRASCAKVAAIYDGKKLVKDGVSQHDARFKYRVGKIVKPKLPFSDKWMEECNSGIHFYITRIEAENH